MQEEAKSPSNGQFLNKYTKKAMESIAPILEGFTPKTSSSENMSLKLPPPMLDDKPPMYRSGSSNSHCDLSIDEGRKEGAERQGATPQLLRPMRLLRCVNWR